MKNTKKTLMRVVGTILVIGLAFGIGGYLGNLRTTEITKVHPQLNDELNYIENYEVFTETRNGFGLLVETGSYFAEEKPY